MSGDIHICGVCKSQFNNLKGFIEHKKLCTASKKVQGTSSSSLVKADVLEDNCTDSSVKLRTVDINIEEVLANTPTSTSPTLILQTSSNSLDNAQVLQNESLLKSKGPYLVRKDGNIVTLQDYMSLHQTLFSLNSVNENPKILLNNSTLNGSGTTSVLSDGQSSLQNNYSLLTDSTSVLPSENLGLTSENTVLSSNNIVLTSHPEIPETQKITSEQKDCSLLSKETDTKQTQNVLSTDVSSTDTAKAIQTVKTENDKLLNKTSMDTLISQKLIENIHEETGLEQPMDLSGTGDVNLTEVSTNLKVICGLDEPMPVLQEECEISQALQSVPVQTTCSPLPEGGHTQAEKKVVNKPKSVNKQNSTKPVPLVQIDKSPKILTVTPKKYKCTNCIMAFACKKDLDRHFRMHTGDKPFACQYCSKKFSRADKRKIHERMHTGDKPYKCDKCPYATTDSTNLKKHYFIHTGEKPFSCQICEYRCRNSNQLTVHIRTHTGDAPYVCYICKYAFKIKSDLTRHLFIHSGQKPFSCTYCDYRCTIKSNLKSHIRTNHDPSNMQTCKECNFKTSSKKNYQQHVAITHNSLRCQKCGYLAKDEADVQLHSKIHPGQKIYQCSMCSFSSDKSQSVKLHVQKKHPKQIRPVVIRGPPVKKHLTKEIDKRLKQLPTQCKKKFQCPKCEAAFVREDSLCCHLRNHSETDKIVAMAVLDLQKPTVLVPLSAAPITDNSISTVSDTMLQSNPNTTDTNVHIDVNVYLNNTVPSSKTKSVQSQSECAPMPNIILNNTATTMQTSNNRLKTQENNVQYSSAILSQAASNLLAFMQNNQNKAVEENMSNMARQITVNSSSQSQAITGSNNRNVIISRPVSDSQNEIVMSVTNIPTHQNINDNTGSLGTQVQLSKLSSQESNVIDAIGNIEFNQASTSIISNNCSSSVDQVSGSGQSNWEHLQRAVLQSVNLQSDDEDVVESTHINAGHHNERLYNNSGSDLHSSANSYKYSTAHSMIQNDENSNIYNSKNDSNNESESNSVLVNHEYDHTTSEGNIKYSHDVDLSSEGGGSQTIYFQSTEMCQESDGEQFSKIHN